MNCPICAKKIIIDPKDEGVEIFSCSEMVEFEDGIPLSHYTLDIGISREVMVVHPYKIVTNNYHNKKKISSRILKYKENKNKKPRIVRFQGIVTVAAIHPDTPEKLLSRIKLIVMLS